MTLDVLLSTFRPQVSSDLYQGLLLGAFQVQCRAVEHNSLESIFGPQSSSLEILGEGEGYWTRLHLHISDTNPLLTVEVGEFVRLCDGKVVSQRHEQSRFEIAAKVQLSRFDQMKVNVERFCRVSGVNADIVMGRGLFCIGADEDLVKTYLAEISGHEAMMLLDDKKRLWCEMSHLGNRRS